jgi:hypothetical protein
MFESNDILKRIEPLRFWNLKGPGELALLTRPPDLGGWKASWAQGREASGALAPWVWRGDSPDENSVLNLNNSLPMGMRSSQKADDGSRKSPYTGEEDQALVWPGSRRIA